MSNTYPSRKFTVARARKSRHLHCLYLPWVQSCKSDCILGNDTNGQEKIQFTELTGRTNSDQRSIKSNVQYPVRTNIRHPEKEQKCTTPVWYTLFAHSPCDGLQSRQFPTLMPSLFCFKKAKGISSLNS